MTQTASLENEIARVSKSVKSSVTLVQTVQRLQVLKCPPKKHVLVCSLTDVSLPDLCSSATCF